jgi:2-iminobutanoate/2-iminopropanoate deaminase
MNKTILLLLSIFLWGDTSMSSAPIKTPVFTGSKPVGPFSPGIKVTESPDQKKEWLFVSGQLPINSETGIMATDAEGATIECMRNCAAVLEAAGMTFDNVVKTTILLTDMNDFPIVNKVYESFLAQPYPARATFQVAALPKGARIEIEMIAVKTIE